jgi:putative phosphoesterase
MPSRIAFIADVHGNLEALQAVVPFISGLQTYCCGDLVGYGANPNEVVQWARDNCAGCVMGNHDEAVVSGETGWFNEVAAKAISWTRDRISTDNLEYLSSLPTFLRFEVEGRRLFVVHGSPDDPLHEYVHLVTHRDLFERYLEDQCADLIALGHTHHPFSARTARGTVFNPGSVGQPRHGTSGAFYAIVAIEGDGVEVELHRAGYDIGSAASKIYEAGLPKVLGERLFEGY